MLSTDKGIPRRMTLFMMLSGVFKRLWMVSMGFRSTEKDKSSLSTRNLVSTSINAQV